MPPLKENRNEIITIIEILAKKRPTRHEVNKQTNPFDAQILRHNTKNQIPLVEALHNCAVQNYL